VVQDTQIMVNGFSLRKISCELVSIDSVWGPSDPVMYHYAERIGVCCGTEFTWQPVVPVGPNVFSTGRGGFLRCYEDDDIYYQTPYFQTLGVPCDYITPVSIDQPEASGWRVYPNPARAQLLIKVPEEITVTNLRVTSSLGQVILDQAPDHQGRSLSLSVQGWAQGMYLLTVMGEQGEVRYQERVSVVR
jgi:hypothetical protein